MLPSESIMLPSLIMEESLPGFHFPFGVTGKIFKLEIYEIRSIRMLYDSLNELSDQLP